MNKYEIVYIFRSSLTSEELESKLQNFHSQLTRNAGQISAVEHWGKRQLAYPIEKERNGNYVVAQFETEPASLPDFERLLKLDDEILRYLIVLSEGELPIPPSMRRGSDERPGYRPAARPEGPEGKPDADVDEASSEADAEDEGKPDADDAVTSDSDVTAEEALEEEERPPLDVASEATDAVEVADSPGEADDAEAAEERSPSDG